LIFNTLEKAPRRGEVVEVPGYDLHCIDVSGSRIARVRIVARDEELRASGK
jgi:CBS domain containing-hemolysin-like protein